MPDLTPDDVARREFRSGFRGYETSEVRAFLAEVASGLTALVEDRAALQARLAELESHDLKSEIAAISREVGEVLEAARQAANTMRERAGADATRWRSEAIAEAETERSRAALDAERLRTDAWTVSEQLLTQCQAQAEKVIEAAEKEALRLLGEAEREAHRMQAAARRESEDLVRGARMESERVSAEAKARHDELIDSALKQSEAAQERTLALEQRRQELLKELDAVRATLLQVEGELDQRRERLGLSPPEPPPEPPMAPPAAAKVVTAEASARPAVSTPRPAGSSSPARSEETGLWVPGETVRVVRPERAGEEPTVSQVAPQTLEPEVKILSGKQFARVKAGLEPGDVSPEEKTHPEKPAPEPQPRALDEDATVKVVRPASFDAPVGAEATAPASVESPGVMGGSPDDQVAADPAPDHGTSPGHADEPEAGSTEKPEHTADERPNASDSAREVESPEDAPVEALAVDSPETHVQTMSRYGDEGAAAFDERPESPEAPEAVVPVLKGAPPELPPPPPPPPYRPIDQPVPSPAYPPRLQSAPRIVTASSQREARPGSPAAEGDFDDQQQLFSDVSGLFSRLRTDEVPASQDAEHRDDVDASVEEVMARRLIASVVEPFEVRDRLLLPIGNRALRNLKRQLTEAQNEALEEIRLNEAHWEPTVESIRNRVRADLVVLFAESFGAGHSAAEEMLGGRVPRPATPRDQVGVEFVDDLVGELIQVLAEGRHSGHGARQLGASLSRVFRGWRTDQSERRVRDLSLRAYHDGLVRALELAEATDLNWRVAGRGCATCRAAGEARPPGLVPPAHPGCECTISP